MASTGARTVNGIVVLYIHAAPSKPEELENEMKVIETFLDRWNQGEKDKNGETPPASASPAAAAVVVMGNHVSSKTPAEQKHITICLASATGWNSVPKETNACVHLYAKDGAMENGYENFYIHNSKKNKYNSANIKAKVEAALNNPL